MISWFRKYFIPHEGNSYKPHLLRNQTAFALLALILVIEGAFLWQAVLFGRGSGFLALILPNTLVDETNQNRVAQGLPALTENPLLTAAAQDKANDMAAKGYFAHTSPQGLSPWYWFQQAGYDYSYAGENLAVNFSDSEDVTTAWMNSPEHRANILSANYTQIGIATAEGEYEGEPTVFVVQEFGKPAVLAAAPSQPSPVVASAAPAPAPVVKPAPTPVVKPKPVTTPTPIVPVTQPTPAPTPIVAVAQPLPSTPPDQNFVAVQGAATNTVSATAPATATTNVPIDANTAANAPAPVAVAQQSNFIQRLFSAPRLTTNVIYIILGILVLLAILFNIFMEVNVQHPQLVLNGLVLLLALGTLIAFNQHLLLANAQIF